MPYKIEKNSNLERVSVSQQSLTQKPCPIYLGATEDVHKLHLDKEFENGSKGEGVIVKTKDGITFEFSTKWRVSMERVNPDREEDDEETKGNK